MRRPEPSLFGPTESVSPPLVRRASRQTEELGEELAIGTVRLRTLGALQVTDPAGSVLPARRKDLLLLAFLARRAPRAGTRTELASLLWEGRDPARARHSLRQGLLQLRSVAGESIRSDDELVWLDAGVVEVDATRLERHAGAGRHREAVRCYRGSFLEGLEAAGGVRFRQWVVSEREKIDGSYLRSLLALLRESTAYQRWAEAVVWSERWAELDPLGENAHLQLVQALHLAGRTEAALAAHAAFRTRLKSELGQVPSTEFERYRDRLQRESLDSAKVSPADSRAVSVPAFVGRDAELKRLTESWASIRIGGPGATVVIGGPAGIGKSRLAEELVQRCSAEPVVVLRGRASVVPYAADSAGVLDLPHFPAARRLLVGLASAPGIGAADPADLAELTELVPPLLDRFSTLPLRSPDDRHRGQALVRVLAEVAYQVPTLVVLDDLPRADAQTRELIGYLSRHIPSGLLLMLTVREGETAGLNQIATHGSFVRLGPLDPSDLDPMVRSMLRLRDEDHREVVQRIARASDGNPGFACDLLREMVDTGELMPDQHGAWYLARTGAVVALPGSLDELMQRRVQRLEPAARAVLSAAPFRGGSVDGRPFYTAERDLVEPGRSELIARGLLARRFDIIETVAPAGDGVRRAAGAATGGGDEPGGGGSPEPVVSAGLVAWSGSALLARAAAHPRLVLSMAVILLMGLVWFWLLTPG
jgi:DNA-binding SARP family transcriptional activator